METNHPKQGKNLTSGVFMTVWQQLPNRPEFQIMARQQEEIIALQSRLADHEARLTALEEKAKKIEITYKSILRTIKRIVGEQD